MRTGILSIAVGVAAGIVSLVSSEVWAEPVETVLHNFTNSPDGSLPDASVLVHGGAVYGVSPYGATAPIKPWR